MVLLKTLMSQDLIQNQLVIQPNLCSVTRFSLEGVLTSHFLHFATFKVVFFLQLSSLPQEFHSLLFTICLNLEMPKSDSDNITERLYFNAIQSYP